MSEHIQYDGVTAFSHTPIVLWSFVVLGISAVVYTYKHRNDIKAMILDIVGIQNEDLAATLAFFMPFIAGGAVFGWVCWLLLN